MIKKNCLTVITEDCPIDETALAKAVYDELKQTENLSIELTFVSADEIKSLNATYRNIDKVTDVLSFPSLDGIRYKVVKKQDFKDDFDEATHSVFLGSIAICTERAKEQAIEYNHSEKREFTFLALHGMLHCFGYDHMTETDEAEMTALAEKIMNALDVTRDN